MNLLTDALCRLGCTEDAQSRLELAQSLGQDLGRPIDLQGRKQRPDVVALVRTALSVPDGELVLADVVHAYEGPDAAAELHRLIATAAQQPPAVSLQQGPLSGYDIRTAQGLLEAAEDVLPADRLRNDLAADVVCEVPLHRTPTQLLRYLAEFMVEPDGLPPAVLLLDHAAEHAAGTEHAAPLTGWADSWAQHAGLTHVLEQRRLGRATAVLDPEIPRCLIVAVDPARDTSEDIVVRSWFNTGPGRWDPQPAEPEHTTLDGLAPALERALRRASRLWADQRTDGAAERPDPEHPAAYVEFMLPYELLNHDMAGLRLRFGDGAAMSLALKYAVHLRSLDRMRTDDPVVMAAWRERWRTLRRDGVKVHSWLGPDPGDLAKWQTALAGEPGCTAVVLDAPGDESALTALKAALAEGIGLAVWDRRGVFAHERREVVSAVFASVSTSTQIPLAIQRLRRRAEHDVAGPLLLGKHIAFFWDDPTRLVDVDVHEGAGLIRHGASGTAVDALVGAEADVYGDTVDETLGGPTGQSTGFGARDSRDLHETSTAGSVNGSGAVHPDRAADPGGEPRTDSEEARP
ncbi:VMAP-C domain-containing protein [Streptomyces himalayensis]|uniref:Uncharacterized protein n=1 Tax=Streptomyces himalayensis subsp. himalayensis TaxID=2756131 RepID=A0A7W0DMW7_9ACTN|nr:hypothetical protein [Streptomyces himalayensis]MBA2947578.1 hypothetical protein [Streptomyces himalayensis subsp. himalayensis]